MGYFEIKNGRTFYNGLDMEKLAKRFGTPTKIVFLDIIENQITKLKDSFSYAIEKNNYSGKFIYLNANKSNYSSEMVYVAAKHGDGVETSSFFDLALTQKLLKTFKCLEGKPIYCNGFKMPDYCDKIVAIHNGGQKIVDIVDDLGELNYLLSQKYKTPLEIGVRINLEGLYNHDKEHDRFGLSSKDLKEFSKILKDQNKIKLTTVHFHQRGFEFEEDKFYVNILKACEKYAELKKDFPSLTTLDIGGGTPWFYDVEFNYKDWANKLIAKIKEYFEEKHIEHPNIIIENGKYTTKDSIINLYRVAGVKNTDPRFSWYVLDASLMVAMPEYYMCGEPMKIVPVNNINEEKMKAKLAGLTCDCDDVYSGDNDYMMLPKITNKPQIIALLGVGSYQESLTSQNSVRHCLIPSEKRVISFMKNGKRCFVEVEQVQTFQNISKLTRLNKKYLEQF